MQTRLIRAFTLATCTCLPVAALAQTGSIRGRVTDATNGAPLAGAAITVAGTQRGAVSGSDGTYLIGAVPAGRVSLLARRIGYALERRDVSVAVGETAVADFVLRPTVASLEQIVVTGTASPTPIRALGTSIAAIDGAAIADSRAQTVDAALQGKIAGAQITQNSGNPGGGGVSVRLRGTGSIISGAEPLYILDGVIVDNNSDQLIDLGARANVQNRLADIDPNDIDRIEVVRGAAAAALYGSRANNGVVQIFTKRGRIGGPRLTAETRYTTERLPKRLELNMSPVNAMGQPVTRYDYQDEIFQTGNRRETYLSFSGGRATTTYYVAGSYSDEEGIIRASGSQRRSARVNLSQQLLRDLHVNVGANVVNTTNRFEPNGEQTTGVITAILFTPTTFSFFPVAGVYPAAPTGSSFANPLEVIDRFKNPQDVRRTLASANFVYTPLANLTGNFTIGYDTYRHEVDQLIPRGSLGSEPTGYTAAILRDSRILNNDGVATFTTRWGTTWDLATSGGFNYTKQFISTTTAVARDLLPTGELVSAGAVPAAGQSRFDLVTLGFYGQQSVAWRDRLYIIGALRRDASSTFGEDERWQLYPKLSVSYVLSDESWFATSPFGRVFNSLRLRSALGYAGNQPSIANAYARFDTYVKTVNDNRVGVVASTTLGNEELKPERQREIEAGADLGFLGGRLGVEGTWYDKRVSDALLFRPLPTATGYISQFDNIGEISNKGIELLVRSTNLSSPRVTWATTATYSRNRNRVEKLVVAPFTLGYANRVAEGEPVGFFFAELPQKAASGEDSLTAAGLIVRSPVATRVSAKVGDPNPDWLGSLLNEVTLGRNFRFRMLLDGTFGNDILNFTRRTMETFGTSKDVERELLPAGDPNRLPPGYLNSKRFYFGKFLEDGSFVKLRELSATYTFPAAFVERLRVGTLDLTVAGRNLKTWTDYSGYDPELNLFGTRTVERGNDFATYPIPRTITLGLRATF